MGAWLFASVLAVSLGAATALSPVTAGLAMFGAGVCGLLALPILATLVAVVIAFMLPLTQLDPGVDTRLMVAALLVPLAVKGPAALRAPCRDDIALRLVPLCALATASITWSPDATATGLAALALIAVVVCLFLVSANTDGGTVIRALRWLVSALIIVSAVAALTPLGQLAGRSRGIFGNPNGLALLLLLAVPLLMQGRWRLLLPVAIVLAFSTASRAGMVAIAVGILFYMLGARTSRPITRLLAIVAVAAILTVVIVRLDPVGTIGAPLPQTSGVSLFRTENSRQFEWATAIQMWREHPLIGHGFGALKFETGNSYLKLLVDLGLLGLATALPFLVLLVQIVVTSKNPLVVGSTAAALVSSVFEAWLLTAGSAFFIVFCLVIQTNDMEVSVGRHDP